MKRWYLVGAVMSLWPVAAPAQEGLAPTAPVVPAPMLHNGSVLTPSGSGEWGGRSRPFAVANWSPFRNPATAAPAEPAAPAQPLPPLPAGVSGGPDANCAPGGCARPARDRSCWAGIRALLCYHDSPTELPKCRPTPYVTPLLGMFPCTPGAYPQAACAPGAPGCGTPGYGHPVPAPAPQYAPTGAPAPAATAGPVVMPPRGTQGAAVQPTWQGRVVPESVAVRPPAPAPVRPAPVAPTIVPTGYKYPVPRTGP